MLFLKAENVELRRMDEMLMERYEAWLLRNGVLKNTSSFYLRTLRTICRQAASSGVALWKDNSAFSHVFTGFSKTAKRASSAHISFNIIGVCLTLALFFISIGVLEWAMQWFGGDPAVAVMVDGKETFPLVPVAVGIYSTFFNIFNVLLLSLSSACSSGC